jgi:hypothetical protein
VSASARRRLDGSDEGGIVRSGRMSAGCDHAEDWVHLG